MFKELVFSNETLKNNLSKFLNKKILRYTFLILVSLFYLIPIYILLVTSFKSFVDVNLKSMWGLPKGLYFDSFYQALVGDSLNGKPGIAMNLMNSVKLVIPATIISAFIGSLNGYIFSKWKFKGSNIIYMLFLFGMFIPYQSILIPLVQVTKSIGFYGTISGLVLVHVIYSIPITTLIFRNYYDSIPYDIIEASKIDGSDFFGTFFKIIVPISVPAFVVVIIWQFTFIWNEFLFASALTSNPVVQPITVTLNNLASSYIVEWNVQIAGSLLTSIPPLIVYIVLQKYFIKGLLAGSVRDG